LEPQDRDDREALADSVADGYPGGYDQEPEQILASAPHGGAMRSELPLRSSCRSRSPSSWAELRVGLAFDASRCFPMWAYCRRLRPTSVSQMMVSTASIWQKNGQP